MRVSALILAALAGGFALGANNPQISPRFRTVYITPMSSALDQHLASRLTSNRVMWVVLDPSNADAVLTDNLDESFWEWLSRNYPAAAGDENRAALGSGNPPFGKHRGTIFLVDPRRRIVLWSTYELPKDSTPNELDRAATRITNQLRAAVGKN